MNKKITIISLIAIISVATFLICYDYGKKSFPKEFFQVYLDNKLLGVIESKTELEQLINAKAGHYINENTVVNTYFVYNQDGSVNEETKKLIDSSKPEHIEYFTENKKEMVKITKVEGEYIENVDAPNGLEIKKVLTYNNKLNTPEELYEKIQKLKPFTIKGYQFTIKKDEGTVQINVLDKKVFEDGIESLITTFVGPEEYEKYLNKTQAKITETGSIIENVYVDNEITVKEKNIPIDSIIFTDHKKLAYYLLYGNNQSEKKYTVKDNEMIDDIAVKNEITVEEFLISNPNFKNSASLVKPGTEVVIKQTDPQVSIVVEKYVVDDKYYEYKTVYQYDSTKYTDFTQLVQKGENGIQRVKERVQSVNGNIVYIEPKGKEELKSSVNEIILKGEKKITNVGDVNKWQWPTDSGWTITSEYAWRIHPITKKREFHYGIDIAGTGYYSNLYAANHGTIETMAYRSDYGYYIIINHNNGYKTLYAHQSKFADGMYVGKNVEKGTVIGYVGTSGSSTGPHLHYEVWKDCYFCRISPWSVYKR